MAAGMVLSVAQTLFAALQSFPPCPRVKNLFLYKSNKRLKFKEKRGLGIERGRESGRNDCACSSSTELSCNVSSAGATEDHSSFTPAAVVRASVLHILRIDEVSYMNCVPEESLRSLPYLKIQYSSSVERLWTVGDDQGFRSCASSLQRLHIRDCNRASKHPPIRMN